MSTKNIAAIIVAALVAGVVIGSFGIASAGGQVRLPAPAGSECSSGADASGCGEAAAAGCADCAEPAPAAVAPAGTAPTVSSDPAAGACGSGTGGCPSSGQ